MRFYRVFYIIFFFHHNRFLFVSLLYIYFFYGWQGWTWLIWLLSDGWFDCYRMADLIVIGWLIWLLSDGPWCHPYRDFVGTRSRRVRPNHPMVLFLTGFILKSRWYPINITRDNPTKIYLIHRSADDRTIPWVAVKLATRKIQSLNRSKHLNIYTPKNQGKIIWRKDPNMTKGTTGKTNKFQTMDARFILSI